MAVMDQAHEYGTMTIFLHDIFCVCLMLCTRGNIMFLMLLSASGVTFELVSQNSKRSRVRFPPWSG